MAAMVVLAGFAVISAVGIGLALHGRSETIDSLEHWQARAVEAPGAATASTRENGFNPPASRIRRLEEELDGVPERLFVMGSVFVLASVLVILGYRKLRRPTHDHEPG